MRFRSFLLAASLVLGLCAPLTPVAVVRAAPVVAAETKDCTVYITRTGARYHKQGCSSLRRSSMAVSRSQALKSGLSPCRRCGGSDCED